MRRLWWWTVSVTYKTARRIAITVVGASVLLIGIALIVLPGPAFLVIPIGLAILSVEFAWARRWLRTIKETGESALNRVMARNEGRGRHAGRRSDDEPGDG